MKKAASPPVAGKPFDRVISNMMAAAKVAKAAAAKGKAKRKPAAASRKPSARAPAAAAKSKPKAKSIAPFAHLNSPQARATRAALADAAAPVAARKEASQFDRVRASLARKLPDRA